MAANDDLAKTLRAGIDAARRGDRATARRLLEQVTVTDERNEQAWMWLAAVVSPTERRTCLQKVLEINPNNARAREALRKLAGESQRRTAPQEDSAAVEQLRRLERARAQTAAPAPARAAPPPERRGINAYFLTAGLLGIVLVVAAAVYLSGILTPTPTPVALAATDTGTPAATRTPRLTSSPIVLVPLITLPPTFTPTGTDTPTPTYTPSITPLPLSIFSLFYTSLASGDSQPRLYSINADGAGEQTVAAAIWDLAFNRTGEQVALVREVDYPADERFPQGRTAPEIFVAPVSNLNAAVQITQLRAFNTGGPSWSPDGNHIVFYSDADGNQELYSVTPSGLDVQQLTVTDKGINRDPSWSPDGSQIVFASDLDSPGYTEIYRLIPAAEPGGQPEITRLTDDSGSSYSPSWSPDGAMITFISDRSGDGDVYVMEASGQRAVLLTVNDEAEDRRPVFTPDSRRVVFISLREDDLFQTYVMDLRSAEIVRVTHNGRDDQALAVFPEIRVNP